MKPSKPIKKDLNLNPLILLYKKVLKDVQMKKPNLKADNKINLCLKCLEN